MPNWTTKLNCQTESPNWIAKRNCQTELQNWITKLNCQTELPKWIAKRNYQSELPNKIAKVNYQTELPNWIAEVNRICQAKFDLLNRIAKLIWLNGVGIPNHQICFWLCVNESIPFLHLCSVQFNAVLANWFARRWCFLFSWFFLFQLAISFAKLYLIW
jgi:hypothetical protein